MSSKTLKKRIALVATAALGFGLMSVVPASATNITYTVPAAFTAQTGSVGQTKAVNVTFGTLAADIDAACAITITPTASSANAGISTATIANKTLTAANGWAVAASGTGALTMTATSSYVGATKVLTDAAVVGEFNFVPTASGTFTITATISSAGVGCSTQLSPAIRTFTFTVTGAAEVGSIYVSKYSIASNYTTTFPGVSAAATADSTAVTTVTGTFDATTSLGLGIYNEDTLGYIGTIASVTSATALVLSAGATATVAAASTGLAANLAVGTPASTYTAYKVINAAGISGMSMAAGASGALLVNLTTAEGTSTTAKVRAVITGAGTVGTSPAIATAANTVALVPITAPSVAGTYPMTIQYSSDASFDGTVSKQLDIAFTLTVTALAGYSNSLSSAYMADTSVGSVTTNALPVSGLATNGVATPSLPVGMVSIALKNTSGGSTGGALTNTLTASVSGPGYISWASTGTNTYSATGCASGKVRSADLTATSAANSFFICGDGTSGVGTITTRVTDAAGTVTTLATHTVTFYGSVTKLTATQTYSIGKAGGGTVGVNTAARTLSTVIPAVIIFASDANGKGVGGLTIGLVSSSTTVANTNSSSACSADTPDDAVGTNAYSSGGIGYYNCQIVTPISAVSGNAATLTWRVLDPATGTTYLTADTPITIGGAIKTSTLSFDKATYGPGDAIVYSVVTKDAAGNTPYDGQAAYGATATANKAFGGTMPGTTKLIKAGVHTSSATAPTLFAPVSIGAVTMTALDGTGLAYMSATATVVDAAANAAAAEATAASSAAADAAAEATDAANAATDAANAAAEAADAATAAAQDAADAVAALAAQVSTLIAGLKAQLTALTNLIIKIQKKVKA